MATFQTDYLNAYNNLKLTRDDKGVLVAEVSHQRRAVHYDRASPHGICRWASTGFRKIARTRS